MKIVFKSYYLNFIQRSIKSSVKNFQLVDKNNIDNILLQFGESKKENEYILDFQFPLTPIQAFGIALSSIQNKLLC